jgi:hypothetical protein
MPELSVGRSINRKKEDFADLSQAFIAGKKKGNKSGCDPKCRCGKCRLCVLAFRFENGLDLWTGEKLGIFVS